MEERSVLILKGHLDARPSQRFVVDITESSAVQYIFFSSDVSTWCDAQC